MIVALHVVCAIAAALFRRERSGQGVEIELPMFETKAAFVLNEHLGDATFAADGRPGYQRLLNPHRRPFRTSDGRIAVLPYTESQWRRALKEIGRSDVVAKEWFAAASDRSRHTGNLYAVLAEAMPGRSTDDWLSTFARLDVPHSRVNDLDDLLTDPHLQEVGFFCPTDATTGRVRSIAQPVVFRGAERRPDAAPPALGADNAAIRSSLGYEERQIAELTASGVLRD